MRDTVNNLSLASICSVIAIFCMFVIPSDSLQMPGVKLPKMGLHGNQSVKQEVTDEFKLFIEFMQKFQRTYKDAMEQAKRFDIFLQNLKIVEKLNKIERGTATYGVTQFSDLTRDEFKRKLTMKVTRHNRGRRSPKKPIIQKPSAGSKKPVRANDPLGPSTSQNSSPPIRTLPSTQRTLPGRKSLSSLGMRPGPGKPPLPPKKKPKASTSTSTSSTSVPLPAPPLIDPAGPSRPQDPNEKMIFSYTDLPHYPPVKYQGQCLSCWAFSVASALEIFSALYSKKPLSVSAQQLLDCSNSGDCNGGSIEPAAHYCAENSLQLEKDYPYEDAKGKCRYDKSKGVAKFEEVAEISGEGWTVEVLKNEGVPVMAMYGVPLQHYLNGIMDSPNCKSDEFDHVVTIVGYGREKVRDGTMIDTWHCRNHWGPAWGLKGHFVMRRGTKLCGAGEYITAVFAKKVNFLRKMQPGNKPISGGYRRAR